MVSAFSLGQTEQPLEQAKYSTPGAMEQEGQESLKAPWASVVLPAIWDNTETSSDILHGADNIRTLNAQSRERKEQRLSIEELNAKYPGVNFNAPMYDSTANYIAQRQARIQDLEWIKQHSTVKAPGAMFIPEIGSYLAKSFTDPVEVGFMLATAGLAKAAGVVFPQLTKFSGAGLAHKIAGMAVPENLILAEMSAASLPLSARIQGRAIYGFAENALQNAAIEPWIASASRKLGDDYTAANSLMNVFVGGLMGSTFHIGGGLVADPFTRQHVQAKLKTAAEYIALRELGEDGVIANAQNVMPQTTLAARDVVSNKGIKLERAADGQWRASFTGEQGLLRNYDGVLGRTRGDAIRKLQFTYATVMRDPVLFGQLNAMYGEKIPAKAALKTANPFEGEYKVQQIRNSNTVTKGGKKFKLQFDSPVDKMFYNIQKILNNSKNKGKAFNQLSVHKDTIAGYVKWITENIGDTTEADIKAQAKGIYNAVHKQIGENLNAKAETADIRVSPFIKMSDLDVKPEFLSPEAWAERLTKQKEILLGSDKVAAVNLLEELYNVDRQVQAARLKQLKIARSDIQKLINTTDEQLHKLTKRELARKNVIDSIKAASKHITDEQLTQYLYMLDVVTGDFARFLEDNNIVYTASKEQQLKIEKRLKQTIIEKPRINESQIQTDEAYSADPLDFFTNPEIYEKVDTTLSNALTNQDIDVLVGLKRGKYTIQEALYASDPKTFSEDIAVQTEIDTNITAIDRLVQNSYATRDLVTYRGLPPMGASVFLDNDLAVGQVIQAKGYLSTSLKEDVSIYFANDVGATQPVRLKVLIPRGMKALDVDATLARNLSNSKYSDLLKLSRDKLDAITDMDEDFQTASLTTDEAMDGAFILTATGTEAEIMLPRDVALKVLDIKQNGNEKLITVTPDATLNDLYGSNILRENVDLFFNKVQEMNENYKAQLAQLELGTPEHKAIATEAFFNGYILSDETINAYPELRIARDLTQEIPGTWLMQATNKESLANRIVGEFMQDVPLEDFQNQYGYNYVYALGNGRYTKSPALAIAETGKAVLYEIGAGPRYRLDLEGSLTNIKPVLDELLKWEPALQTYLSKGYEAQMQVLQRLAVDAINFVNTSGMSFLQYLDAMNLTDRKKIKKQTMWSRLSVNDEEIIYPLQNIPGEIKQIGEVKLFEGMDPAMIDTIEAETIYKSIISGEINKVENLQTEVVKLQKEQNNLKKQKPNQETTQNQLDTQVKTQAKKIKKAKKELEKAKNVRETKINNVNKKTEPYNAVVKGAVDVGTEGKYIVTLFQNADISTLVHETAHIFRRTVLDADMLEQAERALGVKDGKWTVKNEEDFAVAFEKYLAEGKAPVKGLEAMFEAFKSWLTQIYMKLSQSPMEQDFSPEIRQVFDQLFAEERVKMAEQAGFKNDDVTKTLYENALTHHKDTLEQVNSNIKDLEALLKREIIPDETIFEKMKSDKLARIESQLDMLSVPQELTPDEIQEKMTETSTLLKQAENEYAQVAESQFQKNMELQNKQLEFYENELVLDQKGLETYTRILGLSEEQVQTLLNEGDPMQPELRMAALEQEAEANRILEGALKEFGDCARGEL